MSRGFAHCNESLLHLLWFNVAGTHLGVSSTVATPSTRSFIFPGPCHRHWQKAGAAAAARDLCLDWGLAAGLNSSRVTSSMPFSHQYLAISPPFRPSLSSVCYLPAPPLPFLSPDPSTINKHISIETPAEWEIQVMSLVSLFSTCRGSRSKSLRRWLFLTKEVQNSWLRQLFKRWEIKRSETMNCKSCQEQYSSKWRTPQCWCQLLSLDSIYSWGEKGSWQRTLSLWLQAMKWAPVTLLSHFSPLCVKFIPEEGNKHRGQFLGRDRKRVSLTAEPASLLQTKKKMKEGKLR